MTENGNNEGPRRALQRVGAVLAGFVAIIVLSVLTDEALRAAHLFPPLGKPMSSSLFLLATAYRAIYAILGSYLAARIAPDRPMTHAVVLGAIGFVLGCAGVAVGLKNPELGPIWYPIALVL